MYVIGIGEIFLKGKNRRFFQRRLLNNIQSSLKIESNKIKDLRNRILIQTDNAENMKYVFGINSYFHAIECSPNEINQQALSFINGQKTFRITAQRITKDYKTSKEIEVEVGKFIVDNKNIKVDLENPEVNIHINIIGSKAYVYDKIDHGLGGLPIGVSGEVHINVNNEVRSTLAGYLMMKRGCIISLSEDLPLLHKFEHGFNIKIREKNEHDVVVEDEVIEDFKNNNSKNFILKPLIGFNKEDINKLYNKIKSL